MEILIPLHPKLVHFPIALFFAALIVQILGMLLKKDVLCQSAWVMFVFAFVSMPIVVLSGLWEEQRLHLHHPTLDEHKFYAFTALIVSSLAFPTLWFIRIKNIKVFQIVFLVVLIIISYLLGLAAHEGGEMVFEAGVGVSQ